MMNRYRESDSFIVSEKPLNKIGDNKPMAEEVEKRREMKSWQENARPPQEHPGVAVCRFLYRQTVR